MRHTHSHTKNRRSHHKLKEISLSICNHCKSPTVPHRMCSVCGHYRGRKIVDIEGKLQKKEKKLKKKTETQEKGK